jgi:hypothetical protein
MNVLKDCALKVRRLITIDDPGGEIQAVENRGKENGHSQQRGSMEIENQASLTHRRLLSNQSQRKCCHLGRANQCRNKVNAFKLLKMNSFAPESETG